MSNKILVTYASRAGSTAGVAGAIGRTLAETGLQVELLPMHDVADLAPYRAVVAGSAIRGGKWLPEAMRFIQTNQVALIRKPCAVFLVCLTLAMGNGKYRQEVAAWMEPVRQLLRPVSEGLFAGAMDTARLPWTPNELLMRGAVACGAFPRGDHRDWDAIHAWAANLRSLLRI